MQNVKQFNFKNNMYLNLPPKLASERSQQSCKYYLFQQKHIQPLSLSAQSSFLQDSPFPLQLVLPRSKELVSVDGVLHLNKQV